MRASTGLITRIEAELAKPVDKIYATDLEAELEAAFWNYDHLYKYTPSHPSERDSFKHVVRGLVKRQLHNAKPVSRDVQRMTREKFVELRGEMIR